MLEIFMDFYATKKRPCLAASLNLCFPFQRKVKKHTQTGQILDSESMGLETSFAHFKHEI